MAALLGATIAMGVMTGAQAAQEEAYPQRAIRMVVSGGPGAITDLTARLVADALGESLGQNVVVENKPGANGILASEMVARAKPDGYTLLFTYAATHAINPWLIKKLSYDPSGDFTAITQVSAGGGNVLVTSPEYSAKSLDEFVAKVQAASGDLTYCSWGVGSGGHIAMEYLKAKKGLEKVRHIPYKSAPACVNDLAAGHVDMAFADTISPMPFINSGKMHPIAVSGPVRAVSLPDIPTLTEQGLEFEVAAWLGVFGPKDLPPQIVQRLSEAMNDIISAPAQRERFMAMNVRPGDPHKPEEFAQRVRDDIKQWGEIVNAGGVSID